jgi:hypothetical protein
MKLSSFEYLIDDDYFIGNECKIKIKTNKNTNNTSFEVFCKGFEFINYKWNLERSDNMYIIYFKPQKIGSLIWSFKEDGQTMKCNFFFNTSSK